MSRDEEKTKPWQFTLRGLIGIVLIVAASLGYWQERVRRQYLTNRLNEAVPVPILWVWSPEPFEKVSVGSSIGIAGNLNLPEDRALLTKPRVALQLLRADTLEVVDEWSTELVFNRASRKYVFGTTFTPRRNHPSILKSGMHVLKAECFDGNVSIAKGSNLFSMQ